MSPERLILPLFMLLGLALPNAVQAQRMYCCYDSGGHQVCSDSLPPQCYNRAYREISNGGMSVKRVDAPLTPEQKAQRDADIKRRHEDERLAKEQKRKDQALLETYITEKDIDSARDRAVALYKESSKALLLRQGEALQVQKKLATEAEFYRKKPMPPELRNAIKDNEVELASLKSTLDGKQRDLDETKAKLEDDRRRYREILARNAASSAQTSANARP